MSPDGGAVRRHQASVNVTQRRGMVKSTPSLVLSRIVLLVGTMLVIAGCSDSTPARPTPTIEIVSSDWTGWQKQQPEPTRTAVTAERGKSFEVDQLGGTVVFTVDEVRHDAVELSTDEALVDATGAEGVDLSGGSYDFELTTEASLELATPTMDAGTKITLTLD